MSKKCRAYSESKLGLETPDNRKAFYAGWDAALRQAPSATHGEQPAQQEPVAWLVYTLDGDSVFVTDNPSDFTDEHRALPLYTSPPASKPWVGLTDEEVKAVLFGIDPETKRLPPGFRDFARAIEAKLKEKNT